jgi:hypothetical protein
LFTTAFGRDDASDVRIEVRFELAIPALKAWLFANDGPEYCEPP